MLKMVPILQIHMVIDSKFYNSIVSMYSQIIDEYDQEEQIFHQFDERLYNIVEESSGIGWGYADAIVELYYSIQWLDDEEED